MKTTLFYGVKYFAEGFGLPRIDNCPVGGIFVCRGIAPLPAQGVQVISGLSGGAALSLGVTILWGTQVHKHSTILEHIRKLLLRKVCAHKPIVGFTGNIDRATW